MIEYEELRRPERALVIGIQDSDTSDTQAKDHLDELVNLVKTMGCLPVESRNVKLAAIAPRFYLGPGKTDELVELAKQVEAEIIVIDCDLSPSQQRNWEKIADLPVLDRQQVILDIFAQRAQTKEARLQVELAQLEYSLPRLTRAWSHLGRQRGGAKGTRGEGETQLEVDRRLVQRKITKIKAELKEVVTQRATLRKGRESIPLPTAALVGYTNAGKSSLLRRLTEAEVLVEDKLFATLDPTTKRWDLGGGRSVLLTDTVGFIRKLPHGLVDAFRSTLEETLRATVLIHLVDAANTEFGEHLAATKLVLDEIGAGELPQILVFNKIDLLEHGLDFLRRAYPDALFISAAENLGIDELSAAVRRFLESMMIHVELRLPFSREDLAALCHRSGSVDKKMYDDEGIHLSARVPQRILSQLEPFILT